MILLKNGHAAATIHSGESHDFFTIFARIDYIEPSCFVLIFNKKRIRYMR